MRSAGDGVGSNGIVHPVLDRGAVAGSLIPCCVSAASVVEQILDLLARPVGRVHGVEWRHLPVTLRRGGRRWSRSGLKMYSSQVSASWNCWFCSSSEAMNIGTW